MGDSHNPADGDRAARDCAECPTKDVERLPTLVVVAAAVLAFVVCPFNFAVGQVGGGIACAIAGLLAFGVGLDWLAMERRRVRQEDREWIANHQAR
jgi:hypothetical protein